jgi:UPF0755 protein
MKRVLGILVLVICVAAAGAAWWFYRGINSPFKGYTASEQFVDIPQGSGSAAIAKMLADAGVVRDANSFRAALWISGEGRKLKAGEYRFDQPVSARQVADKIARGEIYVRPITFPEGLTIKQMAALYESKGFGPAKDFVNAAKNAALVSAVDPDAKDLEGYLFPDTYKLKRKETADQLVPKMVTAFMKAMTPDLLEKADERSLTVRQLITLASIVEKETGNKDERPLVAAVYANRLRIGMPLQCDPTVIYALDRAGRYDGNLTRANMQIDSPYNTYRYPGLPPGPIASPGRASIVAAANPAAVNYLYFVSRNDGTHAFAATLEEHNRNVQKYQVEYFREHR